MNGWGTLIGAASGFAASLVPEVMAMLKERGRHKRELEIREAQLEAAKAGYTDTIEAQKDEIETLKAQIAAAPTAVDGDDDCSSSWLTFIKSSVRPILTYLFFFLFAAIKFASLVNAYTVEHMSILQALPALWDDETETLFSAVITFWFGSRSISRRGSNGGTNTRLQTSGNLSGSNSRIVGE